MRKNSVSTAAPPAASPALPRVCLRKTARVKALAPAKAANMGAATRNLAGANADRSLKWRPNSTRDRNEVTMERVKTTPTEKKKPNC